MQTWTYPAVFDRLDDEVVVRFPDVPEALTGAPTIEEARALAADALEEAILFYLRKGQPVPAPRKAGKGEEDVALEPSTAARVLLHQAMLAQQLSKVALANRLQKDEKVVRRILSGKGASFELTVEALRAVGVRPRLVG